MKKQKGSFEKPKEKKAPALDAGKPLILGKPETAVFVYAGLIFLFAGLTLFLVGGFSLYKLAGQMTKHGGFSVMPGEEPMDAIFDYFGIMFSLFLAPLLLILSGSVCSFVGIRLLRAAGAVSRQVIPPKEYELLAEAIRGGNENGISQYIRLSSLTGITGTFTKIGLTGLPLATIVLTIILAIIGLFDQRFFDLAQLTLGAFIGSYVQKRRGETESIIEPSAKVSKATKK